MKLNYLLEGKLVELNVKSCAPYAKGWQINATIEGVESELTFYGSTKSNAINNAKSRIKREGRLPHAPYREATAQLS
jgi:hypothetical protein